MAKFHTTLALVALSLGGFGIGLTEFIVAGLLSDIASDLGGGASPQPETL